MPFTGKNIKVYIDKREVAPAARLLECLTRAGLLNERITWEEKDSGIVLNIANCTTQEIKHFQSKRQYAVVVYDKEAAPEKEQP